MGYMKELDIRIRSGGDDAIAAACELAGLVKERRGYKDTHAADEIERLRRQVSSQKNLTLTDEEREAVKRGIDALYGVEDVSDGACSKDDAAARTLLALLERLK